MLHRAAAKQALPVHNSTWGRALLDRASAGSPPLLTLMFTPSTTTMPRLVSSAWMVPTLPLSPPAITCSH